MATPNYDVMLINRDGSGVRQLTDRPGEDGWPAWPPDGRWLAFSTSHGVQSGHFDIWVMRADGRQKRRLAAGSFPVCRRTDAC